MAWNPSPAVQVARGAAEKLGEIDKCGVNQVVIIYITDDDHLGVVSYGRTKELCTQAKLLGDNLYDRALRHFQD